MEFQEYPKRIYKGNESIVVNTKAEENNFLGIITDDKENERRIQSNITQGKESQQIKSIKETSAEESLILKRVVEYITKTELKWAGILTTVGGSATEDFTIPGLTTADLVYVLIQTSGATPVTILAYAISNANTLSVTFSSNPSNDHVISIEAYRVVV